MKMFIFDDGVDLYMTPRKPVYGIHGWSLEAPAIALPRSDAKWLPVEPGVALEVEICFKPLGVPVQRELV